MELNSQYHKQIKKEKEENERYQQLVSELHVAKRELERNLDRLKMQIAQFEPSEDFRKELEQKINTVYELKNTIQMHEKTIQQLQSQIEDLNSQLEKQNDLNFEKEVKFLKEQVASLKTEKEQLLKQLSQQKKHLVSLDEEDEMLERLKHLQKEMEELKLENIRLIDINKDLNSELSNFDDDFFNQIEDLKHSHATLQKMNKMYEQMIIDLGGKISPTVF